MKVDEKTQVLKPGDAVRVVSQTDDTLEDRWLGRVGLVRDVDTYWGFGDAPPGDPFVQVNHGPAFGEPAQPNHYWPEELEKVS